MAKKIAEVPIPKENFLHGYKPITPKFAEDDEEDVKEDTPAEEKPVEQKPSEKKVTPKQSSEEEVYRETYFAQAPSEGKYCKIGVSQEHFELIGDIVKNLSPGGTMTKADLLWNILENHFKTYGNTIREMFNKIPPKNPFERFK